MAVGDLAFYYTLYLWGGQHVINRFALQHLTCDEEKIHMKGYVQNAIPQLHWCENCLILWEKDFLKRGYK